MDNISHSVAGLAAGELIHRSLPEESNPEHDRLRRRLILISCWIASNFPDLDLILTPLLPSPLGYLLHHRGHTHTLLYALPQALLMVAVIWACWPSARRLLKENKVARKGLALSLGVGFGLHMLMDYLNSYGIHPFHPFDSRWFFGDMVFIVEPFFWVAFGVPMAVMVQRRWLRGISITLLLGVPLFFTISGFLPWFSFTLLGITALSLALLQQRSGPRGTNTLVLAAVLGFIFVGIQSFASGQAKRAVQGIVEQKDPASRFLDSAMTPYPTNPLCWMFISIESNESAGTYRLRRGLLSLAPNLLPVTECPAKLSKADDGFQEVTPQVAFLSEETDDLNLVRRLKKENCYFEAWMRFARTPSVTETRAADVRFSRTGPRGNFSEMKFEDFKDRECPSLVPGWGFPRADLLGGN